MEWSKWRGTVGVLLTLAVLLGSQRTAFGDGPDYITVFDNGQNLRCRVVGTRRLPNGSQEYQLEMPTSGKIMTVQYEAPPRFQQPFRQTPSTAPSGPIFMGNGPKETIIWWEPGHGSANEPQGVIPAGGTIPTADWNPNGNSVLPATAAPMKSAPSGPNPMPAPVVLPPGNYLPPYPVQAASPVRPAITPPSTSRPVVSPLMIPMQEPSAMHTAVPVITPKCDCNLQPATMQFVPSRTTTAGMGAYTPSSYHPMAGDPAAAHEIVLSRPDPRLPAAQPMQRTCSGGCGSNIPLSSQYGASGPALPGAQQATLYPPANRYVPPAVTAPQPAPKANPGFFARMVQTVRRPFAGPTPTPTQQAQANSAKTQSMQATQGTPGLSSRGIQQTSGTYLPGSGAQPKTNAPIVSTPKTGVPSAEPQTAAKSPYKTGIFGNNPSGPNRTSPNNTQIRTANSTDKNKQQAAQNSPAKTNLPGSTIANGSQTKTAPNSPPAQTGYANSTPAKTDPFSQAAKSASANNTATKPGASSQPAKTASANSTATKTGASSQPMKTADANKTGTGIAAQQAKTASAASTQTKSGTYAQPTKTASANATDKNKQTTAQKQTNKSNTPPFDPKAATAKNTQAAQTTPAKNAARQSAQSSPSAKTKDNSQKPGTTGTQTKSIESDQRGFFAKLFNRPNPAAAKDTKTAQTAAAKSPNSKGPTKPGALTPTQPGSLAISSPPAANPKSPFNKTQDTSGLLPDFLPKSGSGQGVVQASATAPAANKQGITQAGGIVQASATAPTANRPGLVQAGGLQISPANSGPKVTTADFVTPKTASAIPAQPPIPTLPMGPIVSIPAPPPQYASPIVQAQALQPSPQAPPNPSRPPLDPFTAPPPQSAQPIVQVQALQPAPQGPTPNPSLPPRDPFTAPPPKTTPVPVAEAPNFRPATDDPFDTSAKSRPAVKQDPSIQTVQNTVPYSTATQPKLPTYAPTPIGPVPDQQAEENKPFVSRLFGPGAVSSKGPATDSALLKLSPARPFPTAQAGASGLQQTGGTQSFPIAPPSAPVKVSAGSATAGSAASSGVNSFPMAPPDPQAKVYLPPPLKTDAAQAVATGSTSPRIPFTTAVPGGFSDPLKALQPAGATPAIAPGIANAKSSVPAAPAAGGVLPVPPGMAPPPALAQADNKSGRGAWGGAGGAANDPLLNPGRFDPPPTAYGKIPLAAQPKDPKAADANVKQASASGAGSKQPSGSASVLAASNGVSLPIQYVPVPIVTAPDRTRIPTPPPPQIPQPPQPTAHLNAFTPPAQPGHPGQNGVDSSLYARMPMVNPAAMAELYARNPFLSNPNLLQQGVQNFNQLPAPQQAMVQQAVFIQQQTIQQQAQAVYFQQQQAMMQQARGQGQYGYPAGYLPPVPTGWAQPNPAYGQMQPPYGHPQYQQPAAAPAYVQQVDHRTYGPDSQSSEPQHMIKVLAESPYPGWREWAAEALGNVDVRGNPQVVPMLLQAARQDPAATVRVACVSSLARMRVANPQVMETLHGLLNDPDPRVRYEVQQAYIRMGMPQGN